MVESSTNKGLSYTYRNYRRIVVMEVANYLRTKVYFTVNVVVIGVATR